MNFKTYCFLTILSSGKITYNDTSVSDFIRSIPSLLEPLNLTDSFSTTKTTEIISNLGNNTVTSMQNFFQNLYKAYRNIVNIEPLLNTTITEIMEIDNILTESQLQKIDSLGNFLSALVQLLVNGSIGGVDDPTEAVDSSTTTTTTTSTSSSNST